MADLSNGNEKDYLLEKAHSRNYQPVDEASNIAPDEIYSRSSVNQMKRPQSDSSLNGRSIITNPEYGELLFKIKPDQINRNQKNIAEEADEQTSAVKQSYRIRNQEIAKTFNYDRDRRHAQNVEDKPDSTRVVPNDKEELDSTDEGSENAIIKTIKQLSEGDLEELLNSLPEDKKAILKKIMDKREITKKAGAVEENSNLEGGQVDTSKLGGDSEDNNTESAMTSDATETSKQKENGDNLSSKNPDVESDSKGSGSKSEIVAQADIKNANPAIEKEGESSYIGLKDDINVNSEADNHKNENKREINIQGMSDEKISLGDSNISGFQLEAKDSNDYLVNQEDACSENEDWSDTLQSEPIGNYAYRETKREIVQNDPSALPDNEINEKSLEDSFPAINSYEDNNLDSNMAPLIRVKRTEINHLIKKRDSPHFSNDNVKFSPEAESENYQNEKSESEEYGILDHASKLRNNQQIGKVSKMTVCGSGGPKRLISRVDNNYSELHPAILSESQNIDKMSLGSDTDSVLSGVEGADDNIMYNGRLRGKRTPENSDGTAVKMNLNRSGRTAGPLNVNVVSENSIDVSQYHDDEAFGPLVKNSEEDVTRIKRVRQVKQYGVQK